MKREELMASCRAQVATMLLAYYDVLLAALRALVELLPPDGARGRDPYRAVVQRFTIKILALTASWSRP